ncbi:MAG: hypothetical protein ACT4PQ_02880 [Betaproteobacteria bacterium]
MAHSLCTSTHQPRQTGATSDARSLQHRAWRCLGFCVAVIAAQYVLSHAFQLATASAQETRQAALHSYELRIEKGKLASSAKSLRAVEGEQLALRWVSDEPATVHLHGYDVELKLVPGVPGTMTLQAYATGRFPITLHGGGHAGQPGTRKERTLLYLEVHPR